MEINQELPLNDLEVKSFFLLVGIVMATIPDILTGAFYLWIPVLALILLNLLTTSLHHLAYNGSALQYINDWKLVVWKLDAALFELGMGLSRLTVLVMWMLKEVIQWLLICSMALLLTALVLSWEGGAERYGRGSSAVGEFYAQLNKCGNFADLFEYLAS